ncbi:MAG TPA: carboxypeptidase M32, partial [Opitutaceae bacterium]
MTPQSAYPELVTLVKRAHTLGTVGEVLGWDEQVNLPPGAAEQRAAQHAALAEATHAAASEPRIGATLATLEKQTLSA